MLSLDYIYQNIS